jgi:hypothetical protein
VSIVFPANVKRSGSCTTTRGSRRRSTVGMLSAKF